MWCIDHRHPWYLNFKNLGRRLHIAFPLPGTIDNRRRRHYRGLTAPRHTPKRMDELFGTRDQHKIVMLLAHTRENGQKYPLHTLARRLGIGYASVNVAVGRLQGLGIVSATWEGKHRFVRLNRRFPAWREIRRLAHLIDKASGGEFAALAKAHLWDRDVNKKRQYLRKKGPKATLWRGHWNRR